MALIRSTVPVPILLATIGLVVFGLIDILTGHLFAQFIADVWFATLLSALLGGLIGYLIGWRILRKNGLPLSATPYDVDAALSPNRGNAPQ